MAKVIPAMFTHVQNSAASVWTIQHNLSGNASIGIPIVDVLINVDGVLTKILANIDIVDKNSITVTLSAPYTGKAIVII